MGYSVKAGLNNNSQEVAPTGAPERLNFLDGFRGFLALLVVVGHFNHYLGLKEGIWNESNLLALGVRVPMFFAMSGFVLYLSSATRDRVELKTPLKEFAMARFLRLVPAYYASLLFCYLLPRTLVWTHLAKPDLLNVASTESLLWHLTFLHSWHPVHDIQWGINGPAWMLGYEWQLSLMVPFFLWAIRGIGWIPVIAIAIFLGTPWGAYVNHGFFYASFAFAFLLGIAAVRILRRPEMIERFGGSQRLARILGVIIIIAIASLVPMKKLTGSQTIVEYLAGVIAAGLCLYMGLSPQSWVTKIFSASPLQKVGRVSYSLFLFHYPILLMASLVVGKFHLEGVARYGLYFLTIPIIALASVISYRLFEAPFIGAARAAKKKPAPTAEPTEPTKAEAVESKPTETKEVVSSTAGG